MIQQIKSILTQKQKLQFFALVLVISIASFLEMLSISSVLPIVYVVMDKETINSNQLLSKIYNWLQFSSINSFINFMLVAVILVYILKACILLFRNYFKFSYIAHVQRSIAKRMMRCYIYQPYIFHTQYNSAEIQRNIINDAGTSIACLLAIVDVIVGGLNCTILIAYLFYTDLLITSILLFIFGVFTIGFLKPYSKILSKFGKTARLSGERMVLWINQALGGIKEIKIAEREEFFVKKFSVFYDLSSNAEKMNQFLAGVPGHIMEAVCMIGIILAVIIKLNNGENAKQLIPVLAVIALAGIKLLSSFTTMTSSISRVYYTRPALDALCKDLILLENLEQNLNFRGFSAVNISFSKCICINNVSFRYPGSSRNIIDNIKLLIKKGESLAFIGPSGAGKTTLANIILGVLLPLSGEIVIDEKYKMTDNLFLWHQLFGYIPQNIYLMDDTIRNNIAFGIEEEKIDDQRIWNSIKEAQLESFISNLDNGLDTLVGESGARISGGQKQRIGIARALYNNPSILVLDEATSALDNDTEKAVMEAIEHLRGKITIIIIAHRLSTVVNCNSVYEISIEGKIQKVTQKEVIDRMAF